MGVDGLKKNPRFRLKSSDTSLYFFPRSAPNLLAGKARFSEIL
jgi:hypothetical protein